MRHVNTGKKMNWEILLIYFLIEIDVLSTRSGQSVFATSQ